MSSWHSNSGITRYLNRIGPFPGLSNAMWHCTMFKICEKSNSWNKLICINDAWITAAKYWIDDSTLKTPPYSANCSLCKVGKKQDQELLDNQDNQVIYYSVRKVSNLFFNKNLLDFNSACLHEATLNHHMHVWMFFLSVNSISWWQTAFEWGSI